MGKRNIAIDLFKYISSLLIIGIHVALFYDYNKMIGFFVVDILCRLAVPFFAVCTGFLISSVLYSKKDGKSLSLKAFLGKYWFKIFKLYIIWSGIYLVFSIPKWIQSGWFSFHAFIDYAIATVRIGSYYHLWYLLSVLYAIPIFGFCLHYLRKEQYKFLICILWLVKVASYSYIKWIPSVLRSIFSIIWSFSGIGDGIFCILPLMLVGAYICQTDRQIEKPFLKFLGFFGLMCAECFFLLQTGQTKVSYVIMSLPTAYYLFNSINAFNASIYYENIKVFNNKDFQDIAYRLGVSSLIVYCIHPIFLEGVGKLTADSLVKFLITATISTILGFIYCSLSANRGKIWKSRGLIN